MAKRMWYFAYHLRPEEVCDPGGPIELQVLNKHGGAIETGYFSAPCSRLSVAGRDIPPAVLIAAARLPVGVGCYLSHTGEWLDGWGNPSPPPVGVL